MLRQRRQWFGVGGVVGATVMLDEQEEYIVSVAHTDVHLGGAAHATQEKWQELVRDDVHGCILADLWARGDVEVVQQFVGVAIRCLCYGRGAVGELREGAEVGGYVGQLGSTEECCEWLVDDGDIVCVEVAIIWLGAVRKTRETKRGGRGTWLRVQTNDFDRPTPQTQLL
ncbi:hypothetical protein A0H81_09297 [Grifola frondosa]|uniref:Uncharacterized protein n=1 Tax=Grifola frondosa TaxID=5627 RepID=A0A1C7M1G7_GRIFR|nr:hypothetical protein A0H81_09297 [Grifola frondosa]